MRRRSLGALAIGCALVALVAASAAPAPADANPLKPVCSVAGWINGLAGKACTVLQHADRIVGAGKKLLHGHVIGAAKTLLGSGPSKVGLTAGLVGIGVWVMVGARSAIDETAKLLDRTTTPQLASTWFSATYWRMAALAAVLTLPFLFAAAVQAVVRSDLALLAHAAFGYLPLAVLGVSIAAPVAMLLLSASDQMSAIVSAGGDASKALAKVGILAGAASSFAGSPFLAFLLGLLLAAGAFVLWLELLVREAAVYVVVLMLPLAFAALVWPARRIWAIRSVELLVALILAKFAIVAVLTLAAAGMGHTLFGGAEGLLSGLALITLATMAPWAVLRLLPMTEIAGSAAGSLRSEVSARRNRDAGPSEDRAGRAERATVEGDGDGSDDAARDAARDAALSHRERLGDLPDVPLPGEGPAAGNGSGAAASNGSAPAPGPAVAEATERLPGFPAFWQHPNGSWKPITLGVDEPLGGAAGEPDLPSPPPSPPAPPPDPPEPSPPPDPPQTP